MKNLRSILFCVAAVVLTACMMASCKGEDGKDGAKGADGVNGAAGSVIKIENCFWVIDGQVTNVNACGEQGLPGANGADGADGANGEQGEQGEQGAQGPKGEQGTPGTEVHIGTDGYWYVDGVKTDVLAEGPAGPMGPAGSISSVITIEDGFWCIDGKSTGVKAAGTQITISDEGYWVIDGVETEWKVTSEGNVEPEPEYTEVPKIGWTNLDMPGDLPGLGGGWDLFLPRIWDGNIMQSGFHSEEDFELPAHVSFQIGAAYELAKFKLWPRWDQAPSPSDMDDEWERGQPKKFEVWGSLEAPADSPSYDGWTLLGVFEWLHPEGKFLTAGDERTPADILLVREGKEFYFDTPTDPVRYIRLNFITNYRYEGVDPDFGKGPISIAEISFWTLD